MRTTALTTAALLGLALLGPVPVADAAGETCRGEAATIVGTPGNPALLGSDGVTGTEGRDVVVTNGAFKVSTLGGDDLICVTAGGSSVRRVLIDSGAGDDVVDGTTAPDWIVQAELGEGADQFAGGDAGNSVRGAYDRATPADTERDVIVGGAGSDGVTSGVVGQPNPDVVALGAGNDSLIYGGVTAGGSIDGGAGVDELVPSTLSTPGEDTVIDNAAGRMLIDQQVVATWTGMETFWTGSSAVHGGNSLVFVGTAADETVYAKVAGRVRATFGAGDDSFLADQAPRAGSVIDGGDGRDLLYVTSESGLLDLDLRSGEMVASAGAPYRTSATHFEDASLFAQRVVIDGTDSRNDAQLLRLRRHAPRSRRRGHDRPLVRLPLGVGLLPALPEGAPQRWQRQGRPRGHRRSGRAARGQRPRRAEGCGRQRRPPGRQRERPAVRRPVPRPCGRRAGSQGPVPRGAQAAVRALIA